MKYSVPAIVLGLLIVALGAIVFSGSFRTARAPGDATITPELVDLGRVPLGQVARATFQVKNVGKGPVTLGRTGVKTLEGC